MQNDQNRNEILCVCVWMKQGQKGKSKMGWLATHSFPLTSSYFLVSFFILPFPISPVASFSSLFFLHLHIPLPPFFCLLGGSRSEDFSFNGRVLFFFSFHQQSKFFLHFFCYIMQVFPLFQVGMSKYVFVFHILVVKTILYQLYDYLHFSLKSYGLSKSFVRSCCSSRWDLFTLFFKK